MESKYSPDQERDDAGRFGSGGGSGNPHGSPATTPEAAQFESSVNKFAERNGMSTRVLSDGKIGVRLPPGKGDRRIMAISSLRSDLASIPGYSHVTIRDHGTGPSARQDLVVHMKT